VVQFLGSYVGSLRSPGLWWVNPWAKRRRISTKVRSHHTDILKLNDKEGIPVEMAMVINWRVGDTARAVYAVEDLADFVRLHCEMSMRQLAAGHRYEPEAEGAPSLAGRTQALIEELSGDVARRLAPAGIAVVETEIVRLAYAPEIAQAMLRRQQAAAIVAARQQIVEGAVGMVELALDRLDREHIVDLDEERKATMVSNLLVVLCSDHPAQPMINAGSLYL
jgi:regulator of protease activity HflC (stomatin/prohibitin superfamily)